MTTDWNELRDEVAAKVGVGRLKAACVELEAQLSEVTQLYAVFNDPEHWNVLFESGELPPGLRFQVDEPLFEDESLWSVSRFSQHLNQERIAQGKMERYGPTLILTRTVTRTRWRGVTQHEVDEASR